MPEDTQARSEELLHRTRDTAPFNRDQAVKCLQAIAAAYSARLMNKPPSVAIFVTLASVGLIQLQLMMFPIQSLSLVLAGRARRRLVVVVFIRTSHCEC